MDFIKLINQTESVWDRLKNTKKPIMLYGMGDGALKIISALEKIGVSVAEIFASDEFVRGHDFYGHRVRKLSEIKEEYDDFIIVLGFGSSLPDILDRFYALNEKYELYSPDVPLVSDTDFHESLFTKEYALSHIDEIERAYELLNDEQSRLVFTSVLKYKISGKIDFLKECETPREEMFEIIIPRSDEVYIDLGAYNGDTAYEFYEKADSCKKIIAVEGDNKNFKKLCKNLDKSPIPNFTAINAPAWSTQTILHFDDTSSRNSAVRQNGGRDVWSVSVDNIVSGIIPENCTVSSTNNDKSGLATDNVTFIKMDVEGAEHEAIKGSEKTIKTFSPKLAISAYHRNEDLFSLILQLHEINPDYSFFLRHHPYVPAWETNLYAIK